MAEKEVEIPKEFFDFFAEVNTSDQPASQNPSPFREKLAIVVSTGRSKEAFGVQLTHKQVEKMSEKDVEKYYKRYEGYIGLKTTENMVSTFLDLVAVPLASIFQIENVQDYQMDLREDYCIKKELSELAGSLYLRFGKMVAIANGLAITAKHSAMSAFFSEKNSEDFDLENAEHYSALARKSFEEYPENNGKYPENNGLHSENTE